MRAILRGTDIYVTPCGSDVPTYANHYLVSVNADFDDLENFFELLLYNLPKAQEAAATIIDELRKDYDAYMSTKQDT